MLAKFGAIVTEGRGKLGDAVFTRGHYGACVHKYAPPYSVSHGSRTQHQIDSWNHFQYVRVQWASETDESRLAWQEAAASYDRRNVFGDRQPLTGQAFYVKLNVRLHMMNQVLLHDPPALVPVQCIKSLDSLFVKTDSTIYIGFTSQLQESDFLFFLWCTPSLTPGIMSPLNYFRLISFQEIAYSGWIYNEGSFYNYFGFYPIEGLRVFIRLQSCHIATGLISPPLMLSTIVQGT